MRTIKIKTAIFLLPITCLLLISCGKNAESAKGSEGKSKESYKEYAQQSYTIEVNKLRDGFAAERRDLLDKFVVKLSRFSLTKGVAGQEPLIELTVRNDTGLPVSRVRFHAILITPGRSVPWVDEDVNFAINGGLEPGEEATWHLRPNMFGSWTHAPSDRDDLVLAVKPWALEGADGKIFSGETMLPEQANLMRSMLNTIDYDKTVEMKAMLDARDKAIKDWRTIAIANSVRQETASLEQRKIEAEVAKPLLAKFVIEKQRFYWGNVSQFTTYPFFALTVQNNTGKTVSRFFCHGILSSPGRDTPWLEADFDYLISGDIQAGETKDLDFPQLEPWTEVPHDRTDLVLNATVERLVGPDGKDLWPNNFSIADGKRLIALQKMAVDNGWK